jgi:hypothetical protein
MQAFIKKIWPLVEQEVTADTRVQSVTAVYEGKMRKCWRFIGHEMALTGLQAKSPAVEKAQARSSMSYL